MLAWKGLERHQYATSGRLRKRSERGVETHWQTRLVWMRSIKFWKSCSQWGCTECTCPIGVRALTCGVAVWGKARQHRVGQSVFQQLALGQPGEGRKCCTGQEGNNRGNKVITSRCKEAPSWRDCSLWRYRPEQVLVCKDHCPWIRPWWKSEKWTVEKNHCTQTQTSFVACSLPRGMEKNLWQ